MSVDNERLVAKNPTKPLKGSGEKPLPAPFKKMSIGSQYMVRKLTSKQLEQTQRKGASTMRLAWEQLLLQVNKLLFNLELSSQSSK